MLDIKEKDKIKNILANDGVIAFVTDTVWGLGCLPNSSKAVKKIYDIKKRDIKKPLILMSGEVYPLLKYVEPLSKYAHKLIKTYFPGALTVVLPKSSETPDYVASGMSTVGIRVPNNNIFAEIASCTPDRTLATTSANLSSQPPALNYSQAVEYIGNEVNYVVPDFGLKANGTASTVIGVIDDDVRIFRQGDIVIDYTQTVG
ncbi:MAG: threonylcarbamoyl-AMP synthase [Candidatus Gastranaerophilales bacterium]|nr:threonylcarbamoyl-AMP synthase [Candidatus Gastranaerophilales bacterium]